MDGECGMAVIAVQTGEYYHFDHFYLFIMYIDWLCV
jgi:hypothetical protein